MSTTQKLNTLPWNLIVCLGLFALARPIIKIFGDVFNYEVTPVVTLAITVVIAILWIITIIRLKVSRPVIVLAMSGAVYGVVSILMAVIIQLTIPDLGDSEAKISVLLTAGLIATTIFNFFYGAVLGFIARGIQTALRKK